MTTRIPIAIGTRSSNGVILKLMKIISNIGKRKIWFLLVYIIIFGVVHLMAFYIKSKILLQINKIDSENNILIYNSLVLLNYKLMTNTILIASLIVFVLSLSIGKIYQISYKYILSIIITLAFLAIEFLVYKNYF